MNENVSIKEGNITRKFAPIDKVKVDNTDGTQSIWVPEDDLKTGVLYASDNGIYIASEDGYDAYSEVVIRVEKRIDDGDLIDESDTDWKDIDFDGDIGDFDELDNWDVDTLEEFSDDLEGFDDLFNDEDKWDEEKEKPITEDEMGDFDGDSLYGIDPETGNEMEVSLDEDGFLDEEYIPWSIEITRLPDRTEFYDGHRIVFTGIEVSALTTNADGGDTYTPIPYNELIFPVRIADYDSASANNIDFPDYKDSGTVTINDNSQMPTISNIIAEKTGYEGLNADEIAEQISESRYMAICIEIAKRSPGVPWRGWSPYSVYYFLSIPQGERVELGRNYLCDSYRTYGVADADGPMKITASAFIEGNVSHKLCEGVVETSYSTQYYTVNARVDENRTQTVPVQWISPDGSALEDSYTITVLPDPSGGGSGGGSGGDSGGISYGGKDYMLNPNSVVGLSYDADSKKVIAPNIGEYNIDQAIDVGLLISKE